MYSPLPPRGRYCRCKDNRLRLTLAVEGACRSCGDRQRHKYQWKWECPLNVFFFWNLRQLFHILTLLWRKRFLDLVEKWKSINRYTKKSIYKTEPKTTSRYNVKLNLSPLEGRLYRFHNDDVIHKDPCDVSDWLLLARENSKPRELLAIKNVFCLG